MFAQMKNNRRWNQLSVSDKNREIRDRLNPSRRATFTVALGVFIEALFRLGLVAAVIYVAAHFISKYW